MQKAQIRSVVKNTLLKIDEQNRFRPAFLDQHINAVYEQMFSEMYSKDKRGIQKYVREFTDASTGDSLVTGYTIPNLPIVLPRKGGGLFKFKSTSKAYVVTDLQGLDAVNDSLFDTADIKGNYLVAMSGSTIYGNTTIANGETITYRIIPKFTTFGETDEVLIPYGGEEMFIDRIIETIRQIPPTDLINDNTYNNG